MRSKRTYMLVWAAILMALTVVATWLGRIPVPLPISGAYIHPGDSVIYLSGYLLGPVWGAVVGGLGSCLADILSGAVMYALPTLVIKAVMGLIAGLLYRMHKPTGWKGGLVIGLSGLWMCAGYLTYEALFYGPGMAIVGLPFNLIQLVGGGVIGYLLLWVVRRLSYLRDIDSRLKEPMA